MLSLLLTSLLLPAHANSSDFADDADIQVANAPGGDAIAKLQAEKTEIFGKKRTVEDLNAAVEPMLDAVAACHQGHRVAHGGELTVNFQIQTNGDVTNVGVKAGDFWPSGLRECVGERFSELDLGKGGLVVARVVVTLADADASFVAASRMGGAPPAKDDESNDD